MNVTPEKVEWLRERNCVYTLMHHGWHQGQEMKRNRLYFMVQRDSTVTEQEAEDAAAKIAKALNAHDKLVAALREARVLLELNGIDHNDTADYGNGRADDIVIRICNAIRAAGEPV